MIVLKKLNLKSNSEFENLNKSELGMIFGGGGTSPAPTCPPVSTRVTPAITLSPIPLTTPRKK